MAGLSFLYRDVLARSCRGWRDLVRAKRLQRISVGAFGRGGCVLAGHAG